MNDKVNLRGLILSKFRSVNDFAKQIGWSRNKAARIIDRIQEPSGTEMTQIAELLELSQERFMEIFFDELFTMWTNSKKAS